MKTTAMTCHCCETSVQGTFAERPLARLPVEHQRFIEMFVLAGGSLKEIASQAEVSYPTVRNRLDKVIENLRNAIAEEDGKKKKQSSKSKVEQTPAEILKQI